MRLTQSEREAASVEASVRYGKGKNGKRGIDTIVRAFAELVNAMGETGEDVLGDVFTGAITYGERGQFFTPDPVCDLMGAMSVPEEPTGESKTVCDPACGSGRMLLSVGKKQPHWEYTGQDVDHRATQMTAINLGLNGLRGWAVWQNTLTLECHRVYQIDFNLSGGVIREVPVERSPFNYRIMKKTAAGAVKRADRSEPPELNEGQRSVEPKTQLDLF